MMGLFVLAYAGDMVAESPINRGVCGSLLSSGSCRDLQEWILSPLGLSRRVSRFGGGDDRPYGVEPLQGETLPG
jgi:hypothetical protein